MENKIIFELDKYQKVGKEFAKIFNGNYVIDTIEIIFDEVVDEFEKITSLNINDRMYIMLFLNYYYNNRVICNICPIYNKYIIDSHYISHNECLNIDIQKDYKLIIVFKYVSNRFFYCDNLNFKKSYILYKTLNFNIYSNYFNNFNYVIDYLSTNYVTTMELWNNTLEYRNNIFIYRLRK